MFDADLFTLPRIWSELPGQAQYYERLEQIKEFNMKTAWRKRGIAMTPCRSALINPHIQNPVKVSDAAFRDNLSCPCCGKNLCLGVQGRKLRCGLSVIAMVWSVACPVTLLWLHCDCQVLISALEMLYALQHMNQEFIKYTILHLCTSVLQTFERIC